MDSVVLAFQYIICCWFNVQTTLNPKIDLLFQYIICCWFNLKSYKSWCSNYVSIHYMLLVQKIFIFFFQDPLKGFNTLYVVGSINDAVEPLVKRISFQYIICCWFKYPLFVQLNAHSLFQYIICCWFKSF